MPFPLALMALPAISKLISGAAKGSADERGKENAATAGANTNQTNIFGTRQGALMNALLASGRDKLSRYEGKQGATTSAMQGLQGATTSALANQSREGLELAKLGMEAPNAAAKQSILGSLMKNMTPHTFTSPSRQIGHLTQVKGGMSAANLDPMTRAQGEELLKSAMQAQLSGGNLPGKTDFMGGVQDWGKSVLDVPEATDYSKGLLNAPELAGYKKAGRGETILSGLGTGLGIAGELASAANESGKYEGGGGYTPDMWAGPISEGPANVFANANPNLYDEYPQE